MRNKLDMVDTAMDATVLKTERKNGILSFDLQNKDWNFDLKEVDWVNASYIYR